MVSTASHILENSVADDTAADSRTAGRSSAVHKAWAEETPRSEALAGKVQVWDPESFAQQQILHLVQRVFFPGWPRPAKQVVFAAVDGYADAGTTCGRVSMTMARRLPGSVCVVEAERNDPSLEYVLKNGHAHTTVSPGKIARLAHRIQENLWLLRADEFFEGAIPSLAGLRSRLSELRREFDYTVIHAPAVGACSETGLLGQIADGLILVLDERKTRRATAREAKQVLLDTNVRLLGVVINDRQFPIPEPIYRKL